MAIEQYEKNEKSWFHWFKTYFICPEAMYLYFLVGSVYAVYRRAEVPFPQGESLQRVLREHSHVWVPVVPSMFFSGVSLYQTHLRDQRAIGSRLQERREERSRLDLESYRKEGDFALGQQHYLLAIENFSAAQREWERQFSMDSSVRAKQLYLDCVYKGALSLYFLSRFDEAKQQLSQALNSTNFSSLPHEKILLLNLRGLIYFKESFLPVVQLKQERHKEASTALKRAESDFQESFNIDGSQNSVFLFLRYLANDGQFLAENIPNQHFAPPADLSMYSTSILQAEVLNIVAEACFRREDFASAICLYENSLESLRQTNSTQVFFIAQLSLACVRVYQELLKTQSATETKVVELFALESQRAAEGVPESIILSKKECSIATVNHKIHEFLMRSKMYLRVKAFSSVNLQSEIECRINYGFLAWECAEVASTLSDLNGSLQGDFLRLAYDDLSKAASLMEEPSAVSVALKSLFGVSVAAKLTELNSPAMTSMRTSSTSTPQCSSSLRLH